MSDNDSDNGEYHRAGALEIPTVAKAQVLEHVLGFCTLKDLLSCREVSKFWKRASQKQWRACATVKLDSKWKTNGFLNFLQNLETENPYTNFSLHIRQHVNIFRDHIFIPFGSAIKTLELCSYEYGDIEYLHNMIHTWTPNLKKLVLRRIAINKDDQWTNYARRLVAQQDEHRKLQYLTVEHTRGICWMKILRLFPGIKAIVLEGNNQNCELIFRAIHPIQMQNLGQLRFEKINIIRESGLSVMNHALLETLFDRNLYLNEICVSVNGEDSSDNLRSILCSQGQSLRKLGLDRVSDNQSYLDPIPIFSQLPGWERLNKLTQITLYSRVFTSLRFLRFTPNLISLSIHDDSGREDFSLIDQTVRADMQNVQLRHCVELTYSKALPVEELRILMDWLPNIERVKMILDNHTLELVCERWRNLVDLEMLEGSVVEESGITGINAVDVATINEKCEMISTVRRPNITYLQHLRTLRMTGEPSRVLSLGTYGIKFGIKELMNLETLGIHRKGYGYYENANVWDDLLMGYQWMEMNHKTRIIKCSAYKPSHQ